MGEARRRLATALATAGSDAAAFDARHLLQHATGLDHAGLMRADDAPMTPDAALSVATLARRRLDGEPLSRIIGHREFGGLRLTVRPDVLDPREDTEAVVRLARDLRPCRAGVRRILDLGTGSGALVCALLSAYPDAYGVALDRSAAACVLARDNLTACGFAARSSVMRGSWCDALGGPFDLIVSNPPYIARADLARLPREVGRYDPRLALDGGFDGLDAYRAIFADVRRVGAIGGLVVVEIGAGQRDDVTALMDQAALPPCGMARDYGGHARALAAELT